MATVNDGAVTPEKIVTIGDFVQRIYLPHVEQHRRPGTAAHYGFIWKTHLKPVCADVWLKDVRTFNVQNWLNAVGQKGLARNTLKHIKGVISGIFKLAKQQGFFDGENPVRDTATNPAAREPAEMYAYSLEDANAILAKLPEPVATVFAVATFTGLRIGEIEGLRWEDYRNGELHVARSIWKGRTSPPKTGKSTGAVPVIPQLAQRLEMHRMRSGNPDSGPVFRSSTGRPLGMNNVPSRVIVPALKSGQWHGWHAARRGLGSNLYRLGVPDMVIQRILRHANVATTTAYYVKTSAADVRDAMGQLEKAIPLSDISGTAKPN